MQKLVTSEKLRPCIKAKFQEITAGVYNIVENLLYMFKDLRLAGLTTGC